MKLLAIALLGCSHPMAPITAGDGHTYAVVRLVDVIDEESNMGGLHYTFEIDEPGERHRLIHGGRHGVMAMPDGTLGWLSPGVRPNDYYIADVTLFATPKAGREVGGVFADGLPAYNGDTVRFLHARDRNDARCSLAHLAALGMKPEHAGLGRPIGHERIAIGRITRIVNAGYELASVEGVVPDRLEAPGRAWWVLDAGQLVVVASPSSWFAVDNLASAHAWLVEIAKSGWPVAPSTTVY